MVKAVLVFAALLGMPSAAAVPTRDAITLQPLHADEEHDGCETELYLHGTEKARREVFDYLDMNTERWPMSG